MTPSLAEDSQCHTIESLQAVLAFRHHEAVAFAGTAANGTGVVLFLSNEGTWTLATLNAESVACLVATGTGGRIPNGPVFIQLIPEKPA